MSGSDDEFEYIEQQIASEMYIDELEETITKLEKRIEELENAH